MGLLDHRQARRLGRLSLLKASRSDYLAARPGIFSVPRGRLGATRSVHAVAFRRERYAVSLSPQPGNCSRGNGSSCDPNATESKQFGSIDHKTLIRGFAPCLAPAPIALQLQRPLPAGMPRIVARGSKVDPACIDHELGPRHFAAKHSQCTGGQSRTLRKNHARERRVVESVLCRHAAAAAKSPIEVVYLLDCLVAWTVWS
jgi:hypothetical protein